MVEECGLFEGVAVVRSGLWWEGMACHGRGLAWAGVALVLAVGSGRWVLTSTHWEGRARG